MTILCLDIGSCSCGVAIANDKNKIATGLVNIEFPKNDYQQLINKLSKIIDEYLCELKCLVVGYPKNMMNDTKNESCLRIESVVEMIKNKYSDINIIFQDENFTTKRATELLFEDGIKSSKRKKVIDMVSAIIILQDYLDKN